MINEDKVLQDWIIEARDLGRDAGKAAASWVTDGNLDDAHYRRMLELFDNGDPEAWDCLPPMPNLSGEWADSMTPGRLYEEVTGRDAHGDSSWNYDSYQAVLGQLCGAWEDGVSETFEVECERLLREAIA